MVLWLLASINPVLILWLLSDSIGTVPNVSWVMRQKNLGKISRVLEYSATHQNQKYNRMHNPLTTFKWNCPFFIFLVIISSTFFLHASESSRDCCVMLSNHHRFLCCSTRTWNRIIWTTSGRWWTGNTPERCMKIHLHEFSEWVATICAVVFSFWTIKMNLCCCWTFCTCWGELIAAIPECSDPLLVAYKWVYARRSVRIHSHLSGICGR
jgi:hypothetical protein